MNFTAFSKMHREAANTAKYSVYHQHRLDQILLMEY